MPRTYVIAGTESGGRVTVCAGDLAAVENGQIAGCSRIRPESHCGEGIRIRCPVDLDFWELFTTRYQAPERSTTQQQVAEAVTEGVSEGVQVVARPPATWGVLTPIVDTFHAVVDAVKGQPTGGEKAPDEYGTVYDYQDVGKVYATQPTDDAAVAPETNVVTSPPVTPSSPSPLPWVIGGVVVLTAGAAAWALWPRKGR